MFASPGVIKDVRRLNAVSREASSVELRRLNLKPRKKKKKQRIRMKVSGLKPRMLSVISSTLLPMH